MGVNEVTLVKSVRSKPLWGVKWNAGEDRVWGSDWRQQWLGCKTSGMTWKSYNMRSEPEPLRKQGTD